MKNQLDWTIAIELTKHTNLEKNVLSYLKKTSKNERVVNLPCYINEKIVKNSKKLIKKYSKTFVNRNYEKLLLNFDDGDEGNIQLLAPLLPIFITRGRATGPYNIHYKTEFDLIRSH